MGPLCTTYTWRARQPKALDPWHKGRWHELGWRMTERDADVWVKAQPGREIEKVEGSAIEHHDMYDPHAISRAMQASKS